MLSGDNSILKKAVDAKELTGISQIIEDVRLAATDGISKYYLGEEENIVTAVENSISTNVIGFKEFTSTRGTSPVEGVVVRNGKEHAFSVDANSGVAVALEKKTDYQWTIVTDNDNDGVISNGDEVKPLIKSVESETFTVVSVNDNYVQLITNYSIDYLENSQDWSSDQPYIPYDMVYCDKEGVEHDWAASSTAIKTPAYTEHIQTESEDYIQEIPAEYYRENEIVKVHCQGTYIKAYGNRLKEAGLQLNDFSDTGCKYICLPSKNIFKNLIQVNTCR